LELEWHSGKPGGMCLALQSSIETTRFEIAPPREIHVNAAIRRDPPCTYFSDEAQIREDAACWTLAVREKNVERVLRYYAPDAVTFGLGPLLPACSNGASRRAALAAWFDGWDGPVEVEIRNLRFEIDVEQATTYSTNHVSGRRKSGEFVEHWFGAAIGYRKVDGRWLIVHEDQSVPFDKDTSGIALKP